VKADDKPKEEQKLSPRGEADKPADKADKPVEKKVAKKDAKKDTKAPVAED